MGQLADFIYFVKSNKFFKMELIFLSVKKLTEWFMHLFFHSSYTVLLELKTQRFRNS